MTHQFFVDSLITGWQICPIYAGNPYPLSPFEWESYSCILLIPEYYSLCNMQEYVVYLAANRCCSPCQLQGKCAPPTQAARAFSQFTVFFFSLWQLTKGNSGDAVLRLTWLGAKIDMAGGTCPRDNIPLLTQCVIGLRKLSMMSDMLHMQYLHQHIYVTHILGTYPSQGAREHQPRFFLEI